MIRINRKGCQGREGSAEERQTLPLIHGRPGQVTLMNADFSGNAKDLT